jgi:hypothetical protein
VALVVVAAVAAVLVWQLRPDLFVRGPAVDATTAYIEDVQRQNYAAAYRLLAPDLQARESPAAFEASVRAIAASDGALTGYQVRSMQSAHGQTVVTVAVSRTIRGGFTAHVQVTQDATGAWRISGDDDL